MPATLPVPRLKSPAAGRRWIDWLSIGLFFGLAALPMVVQLVGPKRSALSENRDLATAPQWPRSIDEAARFPGALTNFINDNFGLRQDLIDANNELRFALFHEVTTRQLALGARNRVFLTSHSAATPNDLFRTICDIGQSPDAAVLAARQIAHTLMKARSAHPQTFLMLVPTAPALYPDQLPAWVRPDCSTRPLLAEKTAALLSDEAEFNYPLAAMRRIGALADIIPPTNFHWSGKGPRLVAEDFAETRLGMARAVTVPEALRSDPSDLARFAPGLRLPNDVELPDYAAAGIDVCYGPPCFPQLAPIAPWIVDSSRSRRRGATPKRLLLISDSFGAGVAGYFAEYFSEVAHFSMNDLPRFKPEDLTLFKNFAWNEYQPDVVLVLFHDGGIFHITSQLNQYLWPD